MQHRYVGDVGDFVKMGLLRSLQVGRRLGVAWWLFPDETNKRDGRHITYFQRHPEWRDLDAALFDGLARIVQSGDRQISALQNPAFLPNASFCGEVIPTDTSTGRLVSRAAWFQRVKDALVGCNLVFVDPDNGLEPMSLKPGATAAGKCVSLAQLRSLSEPGRTLIVYHHQSRRKGGHLAEIDYLAERLRNIGFGTVDAVRSRPYSPRAFFILDAPTDLRVCAKELTLRWSSLLSWHPDASAK